MTKEYTLFSQDQEFHRTKSIKHTLEFKMKDSLSSLKSTGIADTDQKPYII